MALISPAIVLILVIHPFSFSFNGVFSNHDRCHVYRFTRWIICCYVFYTYIEGDCILEHKILNLWWCLYWSWQSSGLMIALNVCSFYALLILHGAIFRDPATPPIILLSCALSWNFLSFIFNSKVTYYSLYVIFVVNSIRRAGGGKQWGFVHWLVYCVRPPKCETEKMPPTLALSTLLNDKQWGFASFSFLRILFVVNEKVFDKTETDMVHSLEKPNEYY